jgi:hypothetical protein
MTNVWFYDGVHFPSFSTVSLNFAHGHFGMEVRLCRAGKMLIDFCSALTLTHGAKSTGAVGG